MNRLDLRNQRFGFLTALYPTEKRYRGNVYWHCICECGKEVDVLGVSLKGGNTQSCGCKKKLHIKHGYNRGNKPDRLYSIWTAMKSRCQQVTHPEYYRYGGRGITICDSWNNSFIEFKDWALAHGYSHELQLDRIDNNKGYFPENCRFISRKENCNNREYNVRVYFRGAKRTPSEIAEMTGLSYYTIYQRIKKLKWSGEDLARPSRLKH